MDKKRCMLIQLGRYVCGNSSVVRFDELCNGSFGVKYCGEFCFYCYIFYFEFGDGYIVKWFVFRYVNICYILDIIGKN